MYDLMKIGNKNRRTDSTKLNEVFLFFLEFFKITFTFYFES